MGPLWHNPRELKLGRLFRMEQNHLDGDCFDATETCALTAAVNKKRQTAGCFSAQLLLTILQKFANVIGFVDLEFLCIENGLIWEMEKLVVCRVVL